LSLTAGIDSRATLALALKAGIPFDTYTYDRSVNTAVDCRVAQDLAVIAGIAHSVVTAGARIPTDLGALLNKATYYKHHHLVVAPMQRHLGGNSTITVTANLLEIGRYFYRGGAYDSDVSDHPEAMCAYSLFATGLSAEEMDRKHGMEARQLATQFFADFIEATQFNAARGCLDARDQFYWEYKMSAWHGMILLERDFYADCFIPFNCRAIFEALLGVPTEDRRNATVFKRLIERAAPQLNAIPINPSEWPLVRRPSASKERTAPIYALKEIGKRIEHAMNRHGLKFVSGFIRRMLKQFGIRNIRA
jgi:hypothetical protein